jgi:DNA (cytosine-5)-methyltransferase 1
VDYKITKPVRLIELFAGIGSQAKALELLGVDFEHWKVCEFDDYAMKSYNAVHNTNFKTSDIQNLTASDLEIKDKDKYEYIMTYSYPCTDISIAGKKEGMERNSGTRSSLLWEVERLLKECGDNKPQILLMENVRECHNGKNAPLFFEWTSFLRSIGYKNFYTDMDAKNYGIPQTRKRCFMLSILDENAYYEFPQACGLSYSVKEFLEDKVDKKYYVKEETALPLIKKMEKECPSATIIDDTYGFDNSEVRYFPDVCPTLRAAKANLKCIVAMRGRNSDSLNQTPGASTEQRLEKNKTNCCNTITTVQKDNLIFENKQLRTLTPKEVWRLFGFEDKDVENASEFVPDTQLYKQGGNCIVVNCLVAILGLLFKGKESVYREIAKKPLFDVDSQSQLTFSNDSDDINLFNLTA